MVILMTSVFIVAAIIPATSMTRKNTARAAEQANHAY